MTPLDRALGRLAAPSSRHRVGPYGWPSAKSKRKHRRHLAHVAARQARKARKARKARRDGLGLDDQLDTFTLTHR